MTEAIVVHVLPSIGPTSIRLYPPADQLYRHLLKHREVTRQNSVRHLGTLSRSHPGARLARWDYTVGMLHYSSRILNLAGSNDFSLGGGRYSSGIAALQTLALLWNIGHLPGTFSVEKGVYRHLRRSNAADVMAGLVVPRSGEPAVQDFASQASRYLANQDYFGLARVLAVVRLLMITPSTDEVLTRVGLGLYWPIVSYFEPEPSPRWSRLRDLFRVIRHAAYLTLDCPFTGLQWLPSIPSLYDQARDRAGSDYQGFVDHLSEVLSPIERATSDAIYLSVNARRDTAWTATVAQRRLSSRTDPPSEIHRWMKNGLLRHLKLDLNGSENLHHVGALRLRTFFSAENAAPEELERSLEKRGYPLSVVSRYVAWNSDKLLEPDETFVDVFAESEATVRDVGKFISWIIGRYEQLSNDSKDLSFERLFRQDLVGSYVSLFEKAVGIRFSGTTLKVEPWNLTVLGIGGARRQSIVAGGMCAADRVMNDAHTREMLRRPHSRVPKGWESLAAEMEGIRLLRTYIRKTWKGRVPRKRWFLLAASVRILRDKKSLIEFDGGILGVSLKSGQLEWWGLETKKGRENPHRSLLRRLAALEIPGEVVRLATKHAVCRVVL